MNDSTNTKRVAAVAVTVGGTDSRPILVVAYADGSARDIAVNDIAEDIQRAAMFHGLKQKIVDAAAMSRDPETGLPADAEAKRDACNAVIDRLLAGEWNATARGGNGGGNAGGLLMRALLVVYPAKTREALGEWLDAAVQARMTKTGDSEKVARSAIYAELKRNPKIAPVIASFAVREDSGNDLLDALESGADVAPTTGKAKRLPARVPADVPFEPSF